ncbi:NAD(P)/FAD-dependent oxidoreductase [Nitriliruptor alkaliphilus]|uniref:NAD(P)/FAD-dependent oxidoreductase n=1 Tax=Nitriliruptor alkaliphilus TaxID=427918 RepID=UPI00069860A7|nr:NAD(P)/FAD-dependent oxidoreductase [Nitriliruptor alkaliphilus]
MTRPPYDAIVVGARPAGAATAMLLARHGLDVLVLDREPAGRDTLSTHALMRGAVVQLERWGLLERLVAGGTPPVERVTFHYGDDVEAVDLRAGPLFAPRRTVLDPLLVAAAREAGADVRHGVHVEDVVRDPVSGRVVGVAVRPPRRTGRAATILRARLVIGADGRASRIARAVDAPVLHRGRTSTAVGYRYVADLPTEGYEWVYRPGHGAGLIPTDGGRTVVWAGTATRRFLHERGVGSAAWFDATLGAASPEVADLLRWLPAGRLRIDAGHPSLVRRPWGPGWALVGDAGLYRDPVTSHGITDALRDAELLADATAAVLLGDADPVEGFGGYEQERDTIAMPIVAETDAIAGFDWDLPTLRGHLMRLSDAMRVETAALQQRTVQPA